VLDTPNSQITETRTKRNPAMEKYISNTPPAGNTLYTPAEQNAILAVMRDALALSTTEIMIWVSIAPHVRGVFAYGYRDYWSHEGKNHPYDVNLRAYLADDETEALAQLAVMARDLREAVGVLA
jgi:hypothetical protein